MKKATYVLLGLSGVFLAFVIGIFIGRNSVSGVLIIPEQPAAQEQHTLEDAQSTDSAQAETSKEGGKVNINTASVSLLQTLPNIGEVLAQRIVDYRNENGSFTAIEDLMLVEGIGEGRLEQIREYITVGG